MKQYTNIISPYAAREKLRDLGIVFVSYGEQKLEKYSLYYGPKIEPGIHTYFFNDEGTEVAYYTPIMETLAIHETPRIWDVNLKNKMSLTYIKETFFQCKKCKASFSTFKEIIPEYCPECS